MSLGLPDDRPPDTGPIVTTGQWPVGRRSMSAVRALLAAADVSWRLDPVMTRIHEGEDSQAWITENRVHLGFFDGLLGRIALSDLDTAP